VSRQFLAMNLKQGIRESWLPGLNPAFFRQPKKAIYHLFADFTFAASSQNGALAWRIVTKAL